MDKYSGKEVQNKKPRITDIKVDTSIVARRSLLPLIKGYCKASAAPAWHEPQRSVYPLASIYYGLNADTDPTSRIANYIENSPTQAHFKPPTYVDPYSDEETRIRYIDSKPVCYIVFGKPGLETERLAEAIAIERNSVLISVGKILCDIEETGDLQSRKNSEVLDCGCDSKKDVAWNRIVERVHKRDVLHRGYVLEGLPIIQNCKSSMVSVKSEQSEESIDDYLLFTVRSQSAISDTPIACECKSSSKSTTSSETSSHWQSVQSLGSLSYDKNTDSLVASTSPSEPSVKSSRICNCENSSRASDTVTALSQLEDIFNNWNLKPDIIVYLTCPDEEILEKYKVNDIDSISSVEEYEGEADSLSELSDMLSNQIPDKTSVKAGFNGSAEFLINELHYYQMHCAESIEKFICLHNPQYVIKVDGRYSHDQCFQSVKIHLELLPLQVTITPERIFELMSQSDSSSESEFGHENDESFENLEGENLNLKRVFDEIKRRGTPSDKFQWKLSRWKFLCPVELARGRKIEGKKKLATRFMNWLFFLSSDEAMEAFIENPRPYLLPPNPRPYCRIGVIGPRYSGKTKLSFDLACDFDSVVINLRDIITRLNRDAEAVEAWNESDYWHFDKNPSFDKTELVSAIVERIENETEQDCGDFSRNRGWILDNLPMDFDLCRKLLENDVHIDTAIVLFESEPYSILMRNFFEIEDERLEKLFDEENCESTVECFGERLSSLKNYEEQLKHTYNYRKLFANKLSNIGIDVILCDLQKIDDASNHIISHVRKDYQFPVTIFEENDYDYKEDQVESSSESSDTVSSRNSENTSFPLGDCNIYCPIALMKHNVFWKGQQKYRCFIDEKIYFTSSENSLHDFINEYSNMKFPFSKPLKRVPSLKIFITGPQGCGKSTLAKSIAMEFGLAHIDFFAELDEFLNCRSIDAKRIKLRRENDGREENIYEDDEFEEVELPEDLFDLKYSTDKLTIINFYMKYISQGTALPDCVARECLMNYFEPPFDQCGVVIDSFPNYIEDCEIIVNKFVVPDIIIELECSFDKLEERSLATFLDEWRIEQELKKKVEKARFSMVVQNYIDQKDAWIKQEKLKTCKELKSGTKSIESPNSDRSFNTEVEIELEEAFNNIFPEPEIFDDWESEDSATEKFVDEIYSDFVKYSQNRSLMFKYLENQNIPWIKVNANLELSKVFLNAAFILSPYIKRNRSVLESTYELDNITSENLLSSGYFFLSSFGRFCPVQAYNGTNPFYMFAALARKGQIFTVLYRQYIYFLAGELACHEFRNDPLKYIDQDPQRPMIPALFSIIGPPKCGKTTLGQRFASTYNFEIVSRDEVINYVLNNFPKSKLSSKIKKNYELLDGIVTACDFAAAVKLFLSNPKCITQGCVFDGFPINVEEAEAFASLAMVPIVFVDLEATFEFTFECIQHEPRHIYTSPSHFQNFELWKVDAVEFRSWIANQYGNLVRIDGTASTAGVWRRADEQVRYKFQKFFNYLREAGYDKVRDLESSCVTMQELTTKASHFQTYCPSCISFENIFVSTDLSESRRGLVQYREHFYWFCDKHLENFAENPVEHLRSFKTIQMPNDYPEVLRKEVDLKNCLLLSLLANGGYCLVTYAAQLPERVLIPGNPSFAVLYKDMLHLFCSESCRREFCAKFPMYENLEIRFLRTLPQLQVKDLPLRGYLEQSVAIPLTKAINRVGELRPKLLAISSRNTAAVFVGAYLKAYIDKENSDMLNRIELRCRLLENILMAAKKIINPWVVMVGQGDEKIVKIDNFSGKEESQVEAYEFPSVKFRSTSPTQLIIGSDESD